MMLKPLQNRHAWMAGMICVVGVTLTVTACHTFGGRIDACKLVSATAAGRILGAQVTVKAVDTSAAGPSTASICNYDTSNFHDGFLLLAGRVDYGNAAREAAKRKKEERSSTPAGMAKPVFADVKGLGEAAYLVKALGFFELHVLAHHSVIVITRLRRASAVAVAQSERLARIAIGNLK